MWVLIFKWLITGMSRDGCMYHITKLWFMISYCMYRIITLHILLCIEESWKAFMDIRQRQQYDNFYHYMLSSVWRHWFLYMHTRSISKWEIKHDSLRVMTDVLWTDNSSTTKRSKTNTKCIFHRIHIVFYVILWTTPSRRYVCQSTANHYQRPFSLTWICFKPSMDK